MGIIIAGQVPDYDGYWQPDNEAEYEDYKVLNVSSRVKLAKNPEVKKWFPLSPFYLHQEPLEAPLTPYKKPDGTFDQNDPWISYCAENIWQFMKCWRLINSVDEWDHEEKKAKIRRKLAVRFPYSGGKKRKWYGSVDLLNRKILTLPESRMQIYFASYRQSVERFPELLEELVELSHNENIALWEFDSYDIRKTGDTIKSAMFAPIYRPWGHAFPLAWILHERGAKMDIPLDAEIKQSILIPVEIDFSDTSEGTTEELTGEVIWIEIDHIDPNPFQTRKPITEDDVESLAGSIKELGILQPLIVGKHGERYILIAGHRRLAAAKILGWETVSCIEHYLTRENLIGLSIVENLQREDLSATEEALAFKQLKESLEMGNRKIAEIIGKSKTFVSDRIALLDLPDDLQQAVDAGKLPIKKAFKLRDIDNPDLRAILIEESIGGSLDDFSRLIEKESALAVTDPRMKRRIPIVASQRFRDFTRGTNWVSLSGHKISVNFESEDNLRELLTQIVNFLSTDDSESEAT